MTTTIRLEEQLRERLAGAAQRAGKTPHAFILEAVALRVEQSEQEAEFHALADQRWARMLKTGQSLSLDDALAHVQARAKGAKRRAA
jgi:predicted DNA-binding protein